MAKDDPVNMLSEQFSRLKADDQAAEILHRRANLQHLVDSLSPWELVALKNMIRARPPQFSSMPDLPSELVSMIALHLDKKDVLACAAVSEGWRNVWTQPSVAKHLVSIHFPELSALLSLPSSHPAAVASPWNIFAAAVGRTIPRINGSYISKLAVSEMIYEILENESFDMDEKAIAYVKSATDDGNYQRASKFTKKHYAYSSGRVAWHIDAYAIFLDDLRTTTRTLVTLPDLVEKGERDFVVWTMSESIILFVDRILERTMIVYHIDKKEFRRVTLPNRVARITAHKEAAVLEFSAENPIYAAPHVWRWGSGLAKLQMPPFQRKAEDFQFSKEDSPRPEGFMFHPTQSNVIYYFAKDYSDPFIPEPEFDDEETFGVTVYKFEDLQHINSLRHEFDEPHSEDRIGYGFCWNDVRYAAPITSHGLYGMFHLIPDDDLTRDLPIFRYNFDTLTETFSETREVYQFGMRRPLWGGYTHRVETNGGMRWNGQTYYLQKWRPHEGGHRDVQFTEWAGNIQGSSAVCVADESSTLVLGPPNERIIYEGLGIEEIAVDDDFIVGMTLLGYIAWNFGVRGADQEPWQRNGGSSSKLPRYTDADTQCCVKGCKGPRSRRPCYLCELPLEEPDPADPTGGPATGVLPAMQSAFQMAWPGGRSVLGGHHDDLDEVDDDDDDDDDDLMYGDDF